MNIPRLSSPGSYIHHAFIWSSLWYSATCISEQPILLLLSFDGLRYDYLYKANLTHFDQLRQWAYVPHVRPVFPSKTFPNHVSMATGLYAETHGVIGPYIDPETKQVVDLNETAYWNYNSQVQPIWLLNEAAGAGRYSGCMMWPGCHEIKPPTYVQLYNRSVPWRERVSMVFDWLRDAERPANLLLWYIEQPDYVAHAFGPDSPEVLEQLQRADELLGYIVRTLRLFELQDRVNLVVTSDHGMAAVPPGHLINLDDVVDPAWYRALGPDPVFRIVPETGKSLAVYDRLRDGSEKLGLNYTVYVKEKIPERWHYRNNPRVPDILVVAHEGFLFVTPELNATLEHYRTRGLNFTGTLGNHGYDPQSTNMEHPLLARGPAFRRHFVHTTLLENVDAFELAALVLELPVVASSNGSRLRVRPLLAPASLGFWIGSGSAGFWAAVTVSTVFGVCVLALVFVVVRRSVRRRSVSSSLVSGYMFRYSPVHRVRGRVDRVPTSASSDDDPEEVEHLLSEAGQPAGV